MSISGVAPLKTRHNKMKGAYTMKKLLALLLACCMVLALCACGSDAAKTDTTAPAEDKKGDAAPADVPAPADEPAKTDEPAAADWTADPKDEKGYFILDKPVDITIGAGTATGTVYVYMGGVANIASSELPDIRLNIEATSGSVGNMELLVSKDVEIGSVGAAYSYKRAHGIGLNEGEEAFDGFRALFPMYQEHFYAVTPDKSITCLTDLNGKGVATGPVAGGANAWVGEAIAVWGYSWEIMNGGGSECGQMVSDGRASALIMPTGHPATAVREMETKAELNWVPISDEEIKAVLEACPWYSEAWLSASIYDSLKEDYHTMGQWTTMTTTTELDNKVAYNLTKAVMEHNDIMSATHSTGTMSLPENVKYLKIPLHVGAYQYFLEQGIEIPEELIPPEYGK